VSIHWRYLKSGKINEGEHNRSYINKKCPSYIMALAVNSRSCFEVHKGASTHDKSNPHVSGVCMSVRFRYEIEIC